MKTALTGAMTLLLLTSCQAAPERHELSRARSALDTDLWSRPPDVTGSLGTSFGSRLAACPDGTWVTSSDYLPPMTYSSRNGGTVQAAQGGGATISVGCAPVPSAPLLGTDTSLWQAGSINGQPIPSWPGRVDAIATHPGRPLAIGNALAGRLTLLELSATGAWATRHTIDGGAYTFGQATAWFPGGGALAVSNPQTKEVFVYDVSPDSGAPGGFAVGLRYRGLTPPVDAGALFTGFGSALAVGYVVPDGRPRVIVGEPGLNAVHVYRDGQYETSLRGGGGTFAAFGSSLAVEPLSISPGLDALWVGEPGRSLVHRYVGDAGSTYVGDTGAQVGAAVVVLPDRTVVVGAPGAGDAVPPDGNRGGVYLLAPQPFEGDVPLSCVPGASCRLGRDCLFGVCVGGVLCSDGAPAPQLCNQGEVCVDYVCGAPDSGVFGGDGGTGSDAGSGAHDAGSSAHDAGSSAHDAGSSAHDAGSGAQDAGSGAQDAGSGAHDAGSGAQDAGSAAHDAGPSSGDAGARGHEGDAGGEGAFIDGGGHGDMPVTFGSSGCSSSGVVLLPLLSLVLGARRRCRASGVTARDTGR